MEWKALSAVRADQPQENLSQVVLSLDLDTTGILNAEHPGDDLLRRREQIREDIFRVMAEQFVPRIAANMAGAVEAPENWDVRNTAKVDCAWTIGAAPGGAVTTHHRIDAGFTFEANQAMNPATALYLSRANVAAALADHYLFTLEQYYLGREQSAFDAQMTLSKDGIGSHWTPEATGR
jgi:hypothetical protein